MHSTLQTRFAGRNRLLVRLASVSRWLFLLGLAARGASGPDGAERLGGARATADILRAVPGVNVVLVRTRGVWGSRFSYALCATAAGIDLNDSNSSAGGDNLSSCRTF